MQDVWTGSHLLTLFQLLGTHTELVLLLKSAKPSKMFSFPLKITVAPRGRGDRVTRGTNDRPPAVPANVLQACLDPQTPLLEDQGPLRYHRPHDVVCREVQFGLFRETIQAG